jgi:hypothetical protein
VRENDARKTLDETLEHLAVTLERLAKMTEERDVANAKLATVRRALRVLHRDVDPVLW